MSLLDRLRRARLVRVLLVYLGASWVVIEAADLLQDALSLPEWVVPVAIVLLLAGLVVVGATAWVQGQPATDRAEAAGEVPGDWQVDLPDLAASLRRGRLPHLTWGRAILGGVVAFLALFGLAALLVPGVSGPELLPGDREATEAMEAAPGVAVLPFRITGADLEPWREGMVDLLSRNLDGVGGLRAIDSRTVLARWREVGAGDEADLATALEAARRAGARWALLGVVVEVGPSVRVAADLYEVEGGRRVEGAIAEGAADSVLRLVDELSADVARTLLARQNPDLTGLRISSITTESPAALRAFVEGETRYRRSRFEEALEAYERAVALDSAFALAHFRIASARGWASLPGQLEARAEAYRYRDRLPAREDLMIEAEYLARRGALTAGVALLREGVRRYPDDPELWYQLGDAYLHWGPQLKVTPDDGKTALERAVELDPDFAPYHIHLVDLALVAGDSAAAAERLETERSLIGEETLQLRSHELQFQYLYGSPQDRDRIAGSLEDLDILLLTRLQTFYTLDGEKAGEALKLARLACEEMRERADLTAGRVYVCLYILLASGRVQETREWVATRGQSPDATPLGPVVFANLVMRPTGLDPDAPTVPDLAMPPLREDHDGVVQPDLVMTALLALYQDRLAIADSVLTILDRQADSTAEQDTLDARLIHGIAEGIRGYRALARQQDGEAIEHLTASERLLAGSVGPEEAFWTQVVWPLAELQARRGQVREALRLYRALWRSLYASPALLRRIELHDRLGEEARADSLRRHFLRLWAEGDPDHPFIEQVRRGLPPG